MNRRPRSTPRVKRRPQFILRTIAAPSKQNSVTVRPLLCRMAIPMRHRFLPEPASRTGAMSLSELQDFEAGRRWRNPYWIVEMAAQAEPVQLAREQLFTTAFIAELQDQRLQKSKHIEVLLGQILALLTRTMEQPKIEAQRLQLRSRDAP